MERMETLKVWMNLKMKMNNYKMFVKFTKSTIHLLEDKMNCKTIPKQSMLNNIKTNLDNMTSRLSLKCKNIKTKKCQPAARDTLDLIQTSCVPDRGLARNTNKNKPNEKMINKSTRNSQDVTLVENKKLTKIFSQSKNKKKEKKCQPAARDTPDLIQTECVPDRGLARHTKKNKLNAKKKIENSRNITDVTLVEAGKLTKLFSLSKIKKTLKWQPAARDTPDLIQTECVPDSGLARQ